MANDKHEMHRIPYKAAVDNPLFIETIYPVLDLDMDSLEHVQAIEDGYSLWGKALTKLGRGEYAVFASPLSYPFRFSEKGKNLLLTKLKSNSVVDPKSVAIKTFPNIPRSEQAGHRSLIPEDLILWEEYVSFRVATWPTIEFMRFPTFTAILLDHTKKPVETVEEYAKVTSEWRKFIDEFGKMHDLRHTLGISDQQKPRTETPILVFASFWFLYEQEDIFNRYFGGGDPKEKSSLFKKEISLLPGLQNTPMILKGRNNFFHEYYRLFRWRIYYSRTPIFYDGDWRYSVMPGGVFGGSGKLLQILRAALFTHVVMPAFVRESRLIADTLSKDLEDVQQERLNFFNEFAFKKMASFHSMIINKTEKKQKIRGKVDRINEVLNGHNLMLQFMEAPFEIRRPTDSATLRAPYDGANKDDLVEYESEFFHFTRKSESESHEDRRDCTQNARIIKLHLEETNRNLDRLEREISSSNALLESRINIMESKKNTLYAIGVPALGAFLFALILWFIWGFRRLW